MAITGQMKVFKRSKCLLNDGATVTASSGGASGDFIIDRNPITYWRSVGSTDAATETVEIVFTAAQTLDRIFLMDHNFKSFTIKYDVAGVYTHFAGVTGLDGAMANITETVYARDTSYYEFTPVTTTKIQISVTTTQVVNAQKYCSQIIATEEMGTLLGYPQIKGLELNRDLQSQKMLSGRTLTQKSDETVKFSLDFKDYPNSMGADFDLMFRIHDLETSVLTWLCGGRFGSDYFRYQMRGYRLRDVYPVQMSTAPKPIYSDNVYVNGLNMSCSFVEAVE